MNMEKEEKDIFEPQSPSLGRTGVHIFPADSLEIRSIRDMLTIILSGWLGTVYHQYVVCVN